MTDAPNHLKHLNPEQYRAVTTLNGPLLILAGAGSGKTRVLTRRVAHLLHEGVEPRSVFAVTFTNKAAAEMKERVEELVGESGSEVWVSTFHSSCARILRHDIEHLGYTRRFAIYDDDDQKRIVKEIVSRLNLDAEKNPPGAILSRIDHYKNRMKGVADLLAEQRTHENDPFYKVWSAYEEQLKAADALDFNDLIGATVRLFGEHPDVLQKWRDRFRYLLVDEYQDTNNGQYRLLRLLADGHRNLAVVGDDDQSIYGFRGADINNILGFERDFPDAAVIRLEQNYRSTGHILKVANQVIAKNKQRKEKALWTEAGLGRKIRLVERGTPRDESEWVARAIHQLARQGTSWEDMAIVYRTNATSRVFERELQRLRIPHQIVGGRKFYERREVRDMLSYLRLVANPADDAAFLRVCNVPTRGIGAKTLADMRDEAARRGEPLLHVARGATGEAKGQKAVRGFVEIIDELSEQARVLEPAHLVQQVIVRSGYKAMLEAEGNREAEGRLENLAELIRDAHEFEAPADALGPADRLRAWLDRVSLTGQDEDIPDGGRVTLLTVHNAKGLEYPVVFVVHVMEGQFPHARSMEDEAGLEEERRLAYVAFTRARDRLVITWNRVGVESFGPKPATGSSTPSRFLFDLPDDAVEGDRPIPEPASIPEPEPDRAALRRRLDAFLTAQKPRQDLPADMSVRLTEIDHPGQLTRGRKVHHERFGVGVVRGLEGARLLVSFGGGPPRPISLASGELHLVEE